MMTPTLLLDLDDTLLENSMETFVPAYLKAISGYMADYSPPEKFAAALMAATEQMLANRLATRTLSETFSQCFYPDLGLDEQAMQAPLDKFYAQEYPRLEAITGARPQAVKLVEEALQSGYRLAVATNPLFPRVATLQRLRWAKLPADRFDFALVSTFEDFHFAKPQPAYFAEVLAQLGWPDGPVVVIGDDPELDIQAARQLGLATYWVTEEAGSSPNEASPLAGAGPLEDALAWIESTPQEDLLPRYDTPTALVATLHATLAALHTFTNRLPGAKWTTRPAAGSLSLTEILCHLRDTEREVNLPRLEAFENDGEPFISGVDTDPWAEQREYNRQDGAQAFQAFVDARTQLLDKLGQLPPDSWSHQARHSIFGPTTLQELVGFSARHDRLHLGQMHDLLARLN